MPTFALKLFTKKKGKYTNEVRLPYMFIIVEGG